MENLIVNIQNNEGTLVVSSREVAEQLGKQHKHVLESIRKISPNLDPSCFIESTYKDKYNRDKKDILLTKDGFTLYMFNVQGYQEFKLAYINKFNEMEKQLKEVYQPSYQIQDPIERAKAWIKEEEQRQEQQRLLEEQQPKVEAYNEYMNSDGTYTVTNACRMLKKNRTKVFKKLRELELICKKETKPTKKGIDKGYFKVVIKGTMDCLVVTSQGVEFIRELDI